MGGSSPWKYTHRLLLACFLANLAGCFALLCLFACWASWLAALLACLLAGLSGWLSCLLGWLAGLLAGWWVAGWATCLLAGWLAGLAFCLGKLPVFAHSCKLFPHHVWLGSLDFTVGASLFTFSFLSSFSCSFFYFYDYCLLTTHYYCPFSDLSRSSWVSPLTLSSGFIVHVAWWTAGDESLLVKKQLDIKSLHKILRSTEAYRSCWPAIWGGSGPPKHIGLAGPPYEEVHVHRSI